MVSFSLLPLLLVLLPNPNLAENIRAQGRGCLGALCFS
jgi:hypothetical protein